MDTRVRGATLLLSASSLALAATDFKPLALAMMPILGLSWITVLTTLNVTAQSVLPNWVRGRGLALYLMTFSGAMALGSLAWGQVAQMTSTQSSLAAASLLGAIAALVARKIPLPAGEDDLRPSLQWPEPAVPAPMHADAGPVMVTIEYRIPRERAEAFGGRSMHWARAADATVPTPGGFSRTRNFPSATSNISSWNRGWSICASTSDFRVPMLPFRQAWTRCTGAADRRACRT